MVLSASLLLLLIKASGWTAQDPSWPSTPTVVEMQNPSQHMPGVICFLLIRWENWQWMDFKCEVLPWFILLLFFFFNINYILGVQRNKLEYSVSCRRERAMNHNELLSTRPRPVPSELTCLLFFSPGPWDRGSSGQSVDELSASSAVTWVLLASSPKLEGDNENHKGRPWPCGPWKRETRWELRPLKLWASSTSEFP